MARKERLTDKQEAFAIEYTLNGGNATAAYREVYDVKEGVNDNGIYVDAHKVSKNPKVSLRIAELRRDKFDGRIISLEERKEILSRAAIEGCTKSMDILNKMEGVYVEKHEHSGKIDINDISTRLISGNK